MSPNKLEDAATLLSALPFGAVDPFSTVDSPAHCCRSKRKQNNDEQQKFHLVFPFLTNDVSDIPPLTPAGS
jgi:hypothetical protein